MIKLFGTQSKPRLLKFDFKQTPTVYNVVVGKQSLFGRKFMVYVLDATDLKQPVSFTEK